MDLATIIGLVVAWGAVLFSMFHASEGAMGSYFKPPEIFLVLGGSVGAAMLSMPLHTVTGVVNYVKKWLFNKETHIEHVIKEMVQYAETARWRPCPGNRGPRGTRSVSSPRVAAHH